MIRALAVVLLAATIASAKPLRCGPREFYDDGGPTLASPLPEVPWDGGVGTKRLQCCAVDLRWLDWNDPFVYEFQGRYWYTPPRLVARCVLGRRQQRVNLYVDRDGTGKARRRQRDCTILTNAASVGGVQGTIACKHRRVQGFTLSSVAGALLLDLGE